jgi:hypothetical protein
MGRSGHRTCGSEAYGVDAAANPGDPAIHSMIIVHHTQSESNTKRLDSSWTDQPQWFIKSSCNVVFVLNSGSNSHDGHLDV